MGGGLQTDGLPTRTNQAVDDDSGRLGLARRQPIRDCGGLKWPCGNIEGEGPDAEVIFSRKGGSGGTTSWEDGWRDGGMQSFLVDLQRL